MHRDHQSAAAACSATGPLLADCYSSQLSFRVSDMDALELYNIPPQTIYLMVVMQRDFSPAAECHQVLAHRREHVQGRVCYGVQSLLSIYLLGMSFERPMLRPCLAAFNRAFAAASLLVISCFGTL